MSDSLQPMGCSLRGSSILRIFPGKGTGVGCHSLLSGLGLGTGLKEKALSLHREGGGGVQGGFLPRELNFLLTEYPEGANCALGVGNSGVQNADCACVVRG